MKPVAVTDSGCDGDDWKMYLNMTEDLTWQKKTGGKNLIDDNSDTQKHDKCDGGGGGGDNMSSNVSMSNQKEFYASLFD